MNVLNASNETGGNSNNSGSVNDKSGVINHTNVNLSATMSATTTTTTATTLAIASTTSNHFASRGAASKLAACDDLCVGGVGKGGAGVRDNHDMISGTMNIIGNANDPTELGSRRQATRVFKKSSSNGKITVYLGKRDFVDHITHVDPIDGVVFIDSEYMKERKVFGQVLAAFRYGREDLDVLGLTFRKNLFLAHEQIYPPNSTERPLTRLQERLIKKLGANAYPFFFEVPPYCPASVSLQPAPGDTGKACGVDYELKAFVGKLKEFIKCSEPFLSENLENVNWQGQRMG